jgi:hypothetical protein
LIDLTPTILYKKITQKVPGTVNKNKNKNKNDAAV